MRKLTKIIGVALIATELMVSVTGCADPNSGLAELQAKNEQLKKDKEALDAWITKLFGDKESSFGEINNNEIIGYVNNYHLKDVEIFKVLIEKDGNGMLDEKAQKNFFLNIILLKKLLKMMKLQRENILKNFKNL